MSALQLSLMLHGIAQLFGILELGLSKQVPLKKAIADFLKLLQLFCGFYSFRDDSHAEGFAQ